MKPFLIFLTALLALASCSHKNDGSKDEQITLKDTIITSNDSSLVNTIKGNVSFNQISSIPRSVVLTGLSQHRLVTVYKKKPEKKPGEESERFYRRSYYDDGDEADRDDKERHFMPGLDLIYGYNLLNVAHYDLSTEKLNFLFDHPVLVKSLYYPSYVQDSLHKKPINRNYYLVSVYDSDTNGDTLINKTDLRRFYYFNSSADERIQLIPEDYSVVRSQYDPANDVMYVFANYDANHNGKADKKEPLHIFWFNLVQPAKAKRLY